MARRMPGTKGVIDMDHSKWQEEGANRAPGEQLTHMIRTLRTQEYKTMEATLNDIAGEVGVSTDAIYKWRQGAARPNAHNLEQLVAIGVSRAHMDRSWAEQILRWGQHPDTAHILTRLFSYPVVRHNLPRRPYRQLFGREEQLEEIKRRLSPQSRHWVIALEGIGGVGKSALALEVGWFFVEHYFDLLPEERFDKIIWASFQRRELTPETIREQSRDPNLDNIFWAIADVLADPHIQKFLKSLIDPRKVSVVRESREQLREWQFETNLALQRSGRVLLILDNLEELQETKPRMFQALGEFLQGLQPPTKALVTTRLHGDMPYPLRLDGLGDDAMRHVIHNESREQGVDLAPDQEEALVRAVAGVPLAAWWAVGLKAVLKYDLEAVLERLRDQESDLLRYIFGAAMEALHRRTVVSHDPNRPNYAYYTLLALSFFDTDAGATCDALAWTTLDPVDMERARQDRSLLVYRLRVHEELTKYNLVIQTADRYSILPITRLYIQLELNTLQARTEFEAMRQWLHAARRRWVDWYLDLTKRCGGTDRGSWNEKHFEILHSEWPNLQAVFDWCKALSESADRELQEEGYTTLKQFWLGGRVGAYTDAYGPWQDRLDWYGWLIAEAGTRDELQTEFDCLSKRCRTLVLMGRLQEALQDFQRAKELLEAFPGTRTSRDRMLHQSEDEKACIHTTMFEAAINFAMLHIERQDFAEADRWLRAARAEADDATWREDTVGSCRRQMDVAYYTARRYAKAGEFAKAKEQFVEVIHHQDEPGAAGWNRLIAAAKTALAELEIKMMSLGEAQQHLVEADELADPAGSQDLRWWGYRKRAWAHLWAARLDLTRARECGLEAEDFFRRRGMESEAHSMKVWVHQLD